MTLFTGAIVALMLVAASLRTAFHPRWSIQRKLLIVTPVILLLWAVAASMPIWHQWHGDLAGKMHGHPIWDSQKHIH